MAQPRLFLVDAFNLIFRAYHARQRTGAPPMRTSRGTSTEAVYIFHNMLKKLERQYQPEALAVAYECAGPTFRDGMYAEYKANRTETPPELVEQFPVIERLLGAMRIPVLSAPGFEADDVIGTMARRAAGAGFDVTIVTSDKDMLQLVGPGVAVMDPMKDDTVYDSGKVREYKGVAPERIPDLLALVGDSVDNIPGAPGVGDKGAVALIEQFGGVEEILARAGEVSRKAYRESLQNNAEQVRLSLRLATIDCDAPLEADPESLKRRAPDSEALAELYRELEFISFLKTLEKGAAASEWRHAALESEEAARAWWQALPDDAVLAVVEAPAGGELSEPLTALCGRAGETVTGPAAWLAPAGRAGKRLLRIHDYKAALSAGMAAHEGPVEDTLLLGFLMLADPGGVALESLAARYQERAPEAGAGPRCAAVWQLGEKLAAAVREAGLGPVYEEIDLPTAPVLAAMERHGIRVDTETLSGLSRHMESEIQSLTARIFELAKHPFNINSPPQLGKVLFEEMGLKSGGRTGKTKNYSTAADVLETLAPEHEVVAKVLEYRQLAKLKGTYADALPELLDARSRVHTTFNPAGAATGRLSSSNPNLQNIPVRTELGRAIRAAFVPEPGWTLLVADYSQIELRLLAHFSRDRVLVDAFRNGEDIHARTAAEVFGVPPMMVTPDMRRAAKTVNFGIVYGQTSFGLAQQLGISKGEAEEYIRAYFERYAGVKKWIDHQIAETRKKGYTETLHGRRRPIPDLDSKNVGARSFAERTAVNTPLQGTAADLIKIAMIRLEQALRSFRARMLLQVHDELVLECPPEEAADVPALVKKTMEGAARLEVPLLAETGAGPNWRDAKH
jgi:DNA polymerase-1